MGEVSYLKLKLAEMEGKQGQGAERQHKAEVGRFRTCDWKVFDYSIYVWLSNKSIYMNVIGLQPNDLIFC